MKLKCIESNGKGEAFKVGEIVEYEQGSLILRGYGFNDNEDTIYGSCGTVLYRFKATGKTHLKMLVRAFRKIGKRWRDSKTQPVTTWSGKATKKEWPSETHWAQSMALMYVGSDNRITDDYLEYAELEPGAKLTQHDVDAIVAEDMSNW